MEYAWYDFVGNVGVLLILLCYLRLQLDWTRPHDLAYSVTNGAGALMILISLYFEFNLSAFVVELAWLLISLFGIAHSLQRRPAPD